MPYVGIGPRPGGLFAGWVRINRRWPEELTNAFLSENEQLKHVALFTTAISEEAAAAFRDEQVVLLE